MVDPEGEVEVVLELMLRSKTVEVGDGVDKWSAPRSAVSEARVHEGGVGALPAYLATARISPGAAVTSLLEGDGIAAEDVAFDEIVMRRALGLITLVSRPGSCTIPVGVINNMPCDINQSRAGSWNGMGNPGMRLGAMLPKAGSTL